MGNDDPVKTAELDSSGMVSFNSKRGHGAGTISQPSSNIILATPKL